jgi:hypothetical protein
VRKENRGSARGSTFISVKVIQYFTAPMHPRLCPHVVLVKVGCTDFWEVKRVKLWNVKHSEYVAHEISRAVPFCKVLAFGWSHYLNGTGLRH